MMSTIPDDVLSSVSSTIEGYRLLEAGEGVLAALSGGKDSLLLCLALGRLGVEYAAVTVDMGYSAGWDDRITALAATAGISTEVIPVRPRIFSGDLPSQARRRIIVLNTISPGATPCTHCYSVKVLALEKAALDRGMCKVAFAHHLTDAAASLIKEALYRIDRHDRGGREYRRERFEALVEELRIEAENYRPHCPSPLIDRIAELVHAGSVDTDEPPRQPLRADAAEVDIVRPLFSLSEDRIAATVAEMGLATEGSGCGHGATAGSETPREMVHNRVLRGTADSAFFGHVAALVGYGIGSNGRGLTRARYRRAVDLGADYKPVPGRFDKL